MTNFAPIHNHSEYSALDGLSTCLEIAERCKEIGCECCGLSDHGTVAGHLEFGRAMGEAGLKPIYACELYHGEKTEFQGQERDQNHFLAGAMTDEGLRNLWRIVDAASLNFRFVGRVNWDILERHSEGVFATSACIQGRIAQAFLKEEDPYEQLNHYLEIYKDNFFIEIHTYPGEEHERLNQFLVATARERGVGLVYATDAHFASPDSFEAHNAYMRLKNMEHPKSLYMQDEDQIRDSLSYLPDEVIDEALSNTGMIASKVNASLPEVRRHLPVFMPEKSPWVEPADKELSASSLFIDLVEQGLTKRYGDPSQEVLERAEHEMQVFLDAGLEHYFLQTWDFVQFCDSEGIKRGPGRGCLSPQSMVWTTQGFVPIPQVKAGMEVRTHNGHLAKVARRFEYKCNEKLVAIIPYFGGSSPLSFTEDHKVLAQKGSKTMTYETCSPLRKEKVRKWEAPHQDFDWISAGQIEKGDLVCVPKHEDPDKLPKPFDLVSYIPTDCGRSVYHYNDEFVYEKTPTNKSFEFSARAIHKKFGLDRRLLRKALSGETITQRSEDKIRAVLQRCGFESIVDYRTYTEKYAFKVNRFPRHIEVNQNLCLLIGRYVADGWINSRGDGFGLADHGDYVQDLPVLFAAVFGDAPMTEMRHKEKVLIQWTIASKLIWNFFHKMMPDYEFVPITKSLPKWALDLPEKLQWQIIRGAWAGDGSHSDRDSYTSVSPKLIWQIRTLLWNLGVVNGVSVFKREDTRDGFTNTLPAFKITVARDFRKPKNEFGSLSDRYMIMRVRDVKSVDSTGLVYDLAIDHEDRSFMTDSFVVHNSSAGAIVAYALGITDVCPLQYGLIFERFYNPGREKGFPDIDTDFPVKERKRVRDYLAKRWGKDNVRAIGNTIRMKPKAALDKTYKAYGITWDEKEAVKKIIDAVPDLDIFSVDQVGWRESLDPGKSLYVEEHVGEDLINWLQARPDDRIDDLLLWIELVANVCGRVSSYGVHASGVVVSDVPLPDQLPSMWSASQKTLVSCFPMVDVDRLQFLKQDLLGLRNLDTLADWEQQVDPGMEWSGLELKDHPEELWQYLDNGLTLGVFQIEDGYARRLCKDFKPRSIEDLAAIVALNRPGPIRSGAPDSFIRRRRGEEEITYDHPLLESILEPTYGWFLYQEQVIAFFTKLGYDLSEADAVRKILGKKKPENMRALRDGEGEWQDKGFFKRSAEHMDLATAQIIWDKLEGFAAYSFNLSHAICYAVMAFRTLYAKYTAPAQFVLACLRTNPEEAGKYVAEARRMGIKVLPPDIRRSEADASIIDDEIVFGFANIKGVGKGSAEYLVSLRRRGPLNSPEDLYARIESEQEPWEASRDQAKAAGESFKKKSPRQQFRQNLIPLLELAGTWDIDHPRDISLTERQKQEQELLQVVLSDNSEAIFAHHAEYIESCDDYSLLEDPDVQKILLPGVVSTVSEKKTKKEGKAMGIVTIEYGGSEAEFVVFPQSWKANRFLWKERTPGVFMLKKTDRGIHFEEGTKLTI